MAEKPALDMVIETDRDAEPCDPPVVQTRSRKRRDTKQKLDRSVHFMPSDEMVDDRPNSARARALAAEEDISTLRKALYIKLGNAYPGPDRPAEIDELRSLLAFHHFNENPATAPIPRAWLCKNGLSQDDRIGRFQEFFSKKAGTELESVEVAKDIVSEVNHLCGKFNLHLKHPNTGEFVGRLAVSKPKPGFAYIALQSGSGNKRGLRTPSLMFPHDLKVI